MANQQAAVTVTGFVAGDPTLGGTESFRVLTFRMGSTRSRPHGWASKRSVLWP